MKTYHSLVKVRGTGRSKTQLSLIINMHAAKQQESKSALRKF